MIYSLTPSSLSRTRADTILRSQVEELCEMLDDYQISRDRDLPKAVWDFIREKGFLGMVIPKEYGEQRSAEAPGRLR